MARIAGVNLPVQKHVWVGLQSIYGIGRTRSKLVCVSAGVVPATKIRDLTESQVERLRSEVAKFTVEGDLRREVGMSIKRLVPPSQVAAMVAFLASPGNDTVSGQVISIDSDTQMMA